MSKKVSFGFKDVEESQKESLVQGVFSSVAGQYDLMNNLMSFGLHKSWKSHLISEIAPSAEDTLLDVAGGTGDVAHAFLQAGGGKATVADLNKEMLKAGKAKFPDSKLSWVHANAEYLPFPDNSFDYYTISFGIRNVTNIEKALAEAFRVLKPMGKFLCLEFSQVNTPIISQIYDLYSFNIIPKIGKFVAKDEDAYRYLVESIKKFEPAPRFAKLIEKVGFQNVHYTKLTFGVVAIHVGYKV
ncbi:MAG: bifunctional demethylmenaquinone methyltransferase/2-methoxy-6-polyprenyl-1,4-benzoquinol methylase UbiE [Candidatus Jidaibacter sp.]|jgi:demethylmenaquinone methyltransferase/2-methoxy-6-polyprenyl-1,4-benzoquinol methylase|nr:bifunctional demethylmenaquinone methyltransferase/2-methoxy-6-polyprenyl-1,4-benzoquinol methylase UbiE [Candidatus Jidaibacter sp.]